MKQYWVIIIGGGAAGLMAAITASRQGKEVLIIEKNKLLGRKILVTGNGRCNLTNLNITPDKYYGENTRCLNNIFSRFSSKETMEFFEGLGVRLKTEDGGRVFPMTNQAATVLDLLTEEANQLKVTVNLNECVTGLKPGRDCWEVLTHKNSYQSKSVVITTGGKSYPQLGSTGEGFEIVQKLGHRVIEPRPALVPLELSGSWFHKLQGVKSDAELMLTVQGKTIAAQAGELLFTHYGISGPVVLDLSRLIMDYLSGAGSAVYINFFPGYNTETLSELLSVRWREHPQKTLANSFVGLLPKKLCDVLVAELKLPGEPKVNQLSRKDLLHIAERLTRWAVAVKKSRPFAESMVTAGGVALDEVNARTMESLKAKGLYLAGEILDIDGISGGYNLQFAWSTGYLAGINSYQSYNL